VVLERLTQVEEALISRMPQSKARTLGGLFKNKGAFGKKEMFTCKVGEYFVLLGNFSKMKISPLCRGTITPYNRASISTLKMTWSLWK
jgi:hypothetical protein